MIAELQAQIEINPSEYSFLKRNKEEPQTAPQ